MSFGIPVRVGVAIGLLCSTSLAKGSVFSGATLRLNFLTGSLDSRVTFTRASSATRVNSSGVIETVGNNVARFDYDPVTLAPRGLLIEEQRTNPIIYSEQFDNAAWTKANTTVTADATTSPDGTSNADALFETSANAVHTISRGSITIVANAVSTVSLFIKPNGRTIVDLRIQGGSGQAIGRFTLTGNGSAQTINSGAGVTSAATIAPYPNGWYRVTVTGSADTTSTSVGYFLYLRDATTNSYVGDPTKGAYIWGAQFETAAFPTSYIPTVASQVTRSADVATMTGTNFSSWYNASQGSVSVRADSIRPTSLSPATRVFQFDDGTGNQNIRSANTSTLQVINGGVVQANISTTPAIAFDGTTFRFASAWKADDFASVTTGSVATDASGTIPTVTQLTFGGGTGAGVLNGHIQSFTYYPRRLPNSQLQALTA